MRRVSQVRTRPARIGTTVADATSRALPVLVSRTAAACSRTAGRVAAAISVIPPMECPAITARSPGARVASSTASRSSASGSVPYAGLAGLRPWPRWS